MAERKKHKKIIAIIGPINCSGGISSVVNSIITVDELKKEMDLIGINTSNYKDSNFIGNLIAFINSIIKFFYLILSNKPNLAHIHTSYGISFFRKAIFIFLSSFLKVKVILHFHASRFDDFFINSTGTRKRIIEFVLRKSNAIVVLCNNWKEKIEKKFAQKNVIVIHNPVPSNVEQIISSEQRSNSDYVKILFLGFLIRTKGIYDILEIAERFSENQLSAKFVVCGKGEEEREFLKKITKKKIRNIEYLGWVSGQKKIDLYRQCDIFFLPSYKEGMPIVLLEALGFGLPIIATKVGGIPEIVIEEENGYLLKPGEIEGFVEKLRILISDNRKRTSFGLKSRIIAEKFRREQIAREWSQLYQRLLD